jgi:sulfonate transport system substrate-binding protein
MRLCTLRSIVRLAAVLLACGTLANCSGGREGNVVRIPLGAGGVGFLPLYVMRDAALIEKHAQALGIQDVDVEWIELGGPAVMNDALLSGSVDFIAAGPPAFLTLWDRTRTSAQVHGVAAIASLPMYLNTRAAQLDSIDDVGPNDKIAVTAVKVSIPAIIMQMYALDRYGIDEAFRFDKYTVTMTHPDGVVAMLSGTGGINSHFTSPPFHQREIADPAIRTILTTTDVLGGPATFTMLSTTRTFHDGHPQLYAAVLAALEEAQAMIRDDLPWAASVLIGAEASAGFEEAELVDVLSDDDIEFTATPQNVMDYAEFMYRIGSIENRPESWKDLFFAEIHALPGS